MTSFDPCHRSLQNGLVKHSYIRTYIQKYLPYKYYNTYIKTYNTYNMQKST